MYTVLHNAAGVLKLDLKRHTFQVAKRGFAKTCVFSVGPRNAENLGKVNPLSSFAVVIKPCNNRYGI